jgi:sugar O-acyltransferase (sialic acid O-acetyltransferase NeuD family)
MVKRIIIFGSSGHATVIVSMLERLGYDIAGYVDSFAPVGNLVAGYPVLGDETNLSALFDSYQTNAMVIAIGDNRKRWEVVLRLKQTGIDIEFPAIADPSAIIAGNCKIGSGTVIMPCAVVNPFATLGDFVVANTASVTEHDCLLGDFSSLAPGAVLGGNVEVGVRSFVGLGAKVIQKRTIGMDSVVAAGAVVTENIPDRVLAAGVPARIKKRDYTNPSLFS